MQIVYWRCGPDLKFERTRLAWFETYVAFGYLCNESSWLIPGTYPVDI